MIRGGDRVFAFDFRKPDDASDGPDPAGHDSADPLQLTSGKNLTHLRTRVSAAQQVRRRAGDYQVELRNGRALGHAYGGGIVFGAGLAQRQAKPDDGGDKG